MALEKPHHRFKPKGKYEGAPEQRRRGLFPTGREWGVGHLGTRFGRWLSKAATAQHVKEDAARILPVFLLLLAGTDHCAGVGNNSAEPAAALCSAADNPCCYRACPIISSNVSVRQVPPVGYAGIIFVVLDRVLDDFDKVAHRACRPTAMPRTARSAALLDMSASTDSNRTPQAGDPNNLANAIHAISMHIQIRAVDAVIDKLDKLIPG
jgi:hypothetical protein